MQNKPSVLLILLVVGVPALFVAFLLWPRMQARTVDNTDTTKQLHLSSEIESNKDPSVDSEVADTTKPVLDEKPDDPNLSPKLRLEKNETKSKAESTKQANQEQSEIDRALELARSQLNEARSSFETYLDTVKLEDVEEYEPKEWNEIAEIISLAQKIEEPSVAIAKYAAAKEQLRGLISDIPNRRTLRSLQLLIGQKDYAAYLRKLNESLASRPALRSRLASSWDEVDKWGKAEWLSLINNECKQLAPDDGGFADVYHALSDLQNDLGMEGLAKDSSQIAWENSFRMTDPVRASESGLRSARRFMRTHEYSEVAERINKVSGKLIIAVAEPYEQMRLLSEIGRISRKPQGHQTLLALISKADNSSRSYLRTYWKQIYECKIYAESKSPAEIRSVCAKVPKYDGSRGFNPFDANTMSYAYAGVSAARTKNQSAFWEAILLAESQQLDSTGVEIRHQQSQIALVEADLRAGNVRRAMITAMNMTDPKTRAQTLLPILANHPEMTPSFLAPTLFQTFGDLDQGCVALSKSFPALKLSLGGREEAVNWIFDLRQQSVRIAALISMARDHLIPTSSRIAAVAEPAELDPTNFRNLLRNAETDTALLQQPMDRAWAYLWIAFCWKKLAQPASYLSALKKSDEAITSCWLNFWKGHTAPRRRGYKKYGVLREQVPELQQITNYYVTLAEIQAFNLNEPRSAVENVINAARSTHPFNGGILQRARLWIVTEEIHQNCGFRSETLNSAYANANPSLYFKAILSAKKGEQPGLLNAILAMVEKRKANRYYREHSINYYARGLAELAILAAKQGKVEQYREYRRKAIGNIESRGASESINLALYQADAFAGEFNLAKKGLESRHKFLPLFGPSAKVAATLCSKLSLASRTEEAVQLLPSSKEPYYRIQAMHSIAACRSKSLPKTQLVEWVDGLQSLDRISAICGLAYPNPEPLE